MPHELFDFYQVNAAFQKVGGECMAHTVKRSVFSSNRLIGGLTFFLISTKLKIAPRERKEDALRDG